MTGRMLDRAAALFATLSTQHNVISRPQALRCGEMAALLHGGPEAVLTGPAALLGLGIIAAEPAIFDVLTPMRRRRESLAFVAIHRTTRMPRTIVRKGGRLYAPPERALADAARSLTDLREARALIAGAIQRGHCALESLGQELAEGPRRHSALLRQVLAEAADGIRSPAEGDLRDLIERSDLPSPMFNARLFTPEGTFIACPDAWWPDAGVAVEVDSREWHLRPADWERTMQRHTRMGRHGIVVLHFSPGQIRRDRATVVSAIGDALRAGRAKPRLPTQARPAA
jgi:very-short-patch-repair endonuclease